MRGGGLDAGAHPERDGEDERGGGATTVTNSAAKACVSGEEKDEGEGVLGAPGADSLHTTT